ncbi:MAG: hypothetical protein GX115_08290 [Ruminiclostridium sp.]|nr:hypothetical protein [Ruminiclostridium sp.]
MKKTRFIALVLAVAVMLIGAGYAWWSETVTLNTDVTTGVLDMDIVSFTSEQSQNVTITNANGNIGLDADDTDSLDVNINNLYPGAFGKAVIGIQNNGTMEVKIMAGSLVASAVTGGFENYYDRFQVSITPSFNDDALIDDPQIISTLYDAGYGYRTVDDITIQPEEVLYVIINAELDENDTNLEGELFEITVNPTFEQFNR